MELTGEKKAMPQLDEKLRACRDLCNLRDSVQARIDRAVEEKTSVGEHIFRRVMSEYRQELDRIEQQIKPLEMAIEEARRAYEIELEKARPVLAEIEDELAETEFRGRVGEYDSTEISETRNRILPRLEEQKERVSQLENQLEMLANRSVENKRSEAPVDENVPVSTPPAEEDMPVGAAPFEESVPESAPPLEPHEEPRAKIRAEEQEEPRATTKAEEQTDVWLQDEWYANESAKKEPEAKADGASEEEDPLAALADPKPEGSTQEDAAGGFLNLVVNTGSHAGKRIPLLPMTMSIGREHDNNIELKDQEVARYHARITYASGRFTLENLVGSSGTTVNDVEIGEASLKSGDLIRLGNTEISVE